MRILLAGQRSFGRAVLDALSDAGHDIVAVAAPVSAGDRLFMACDLRGLPVIPAGTLRADTMPANVDLIVAAHSHDFIGRKTRLKARLGAIGYHPSLLPRHRGRDAIRWTIKMGDPVAGGSVYWLSDNVDAGDIAAQDYCHVPPGHTASGLWRDQLFDMGVRLILRVASDLAAGIMVAIPQDESCATWEPSWDRPPVRRPDLIMLGRGCPGMTVIRERHGDTISGALQTR
jgi:methionyl-tRNA formyltransferase